MLNEVETSRHLISIQFYFILMILITEDHHFFNDCNFESAVWRIKLYIVVIVFFFTIYNKNAKQKNITLSELFQNSIEKSQNQANSIALTHIYHDRSLSCLSTSTSIKSDGVKLVILKNDLNIVATQSCLGRCYVRS